MNRKRERARRGSGADVSLLTLGVMLFQASAMGLLAFKTSPIDVQALIFAVALPLVTRLLTRALPKYLGADGVLLNLTLMLCSVSLVTLKAIAKSPITPRNQAIYMACGLAAMVAGMLFVRLVRRPEKWVLPLMLLSAAFLAAPIALGSWKGGAKNWIWIKQGSISLQPSEFVKVSLMVILSASLSRRSSRGRIAFTLTFAAMLCGILLYERDLGALLLYFLTTVIVFFLATSNLPLTLAALGAGAGGSVAAYYLFDYVKKRIAGWKNPWADPYDGGLQIIQSLIAIASGGTFGRGLGLGLPRNIPLYHSDFIFAAICEEFGCLFAVGILAVYVLLVMRGISIAMNAHQGFHALLSFAVVSMLGLQTLLIVGGNIRLIPLTGVTLPFIASGGSSMISYMGAMGLLMGVASVNREREKQQRERAEWLEVIRE